MVSSAEKVQILTPQESCQAFDDEARQHLGMSGEEFLGKWRAGEFHDPEDPEVRWVASLLALVSAPGERA